MMTEKRRGTLGVLCSRGAGKIYVYYINGIVYSALPIVARFCYIEDVHHNGAQSLLSLLIHFTRLIFKGPTLENRSNARFCAQC